ncbi:hypothetical protein CBL_20931 [Carabus blaptoides fortunei]
MKNKTTKRSAHELLFNFDPRNALQNIVTLALQEDQIQDEDVEQLRIEALQNIERSQRAQKFRFDKFTSTQGTRRNPDPRTDLDVKKGRLLAKIPMPATI